MSREDQTKLYSERVLDVLGEVVDLLSERRRLGAVNNEIEYLIGARSELAHEAYENLGLTLEELREILGVNRTTLKNNILGDRARKRAQARFARGADGTAAYRREGLSGKGAL